MRARDERNCARTVMTGFGEANYAAARRDMDCFAPVRRETRELRVALSARLARER